MSDQPQIPESAPELATEQVTEPAALAPAPTDAPAAEPVVAPPPESPVELPPPLPGSDATAAAQRPEVAVGAAFAGGLALAMILKRLGR